MLKWLLVLSVVFVPFTAGADPDSCTLADVKKIYEDCNPTPKPIIKRKWKPRKKVKKKPCTCTGEKGEKGDKGDPGPEGPRGEKGPPGASDLYYTVKVYNIVEDRTRLNIGLGYLAGYFQHPHQYTWAQGPSLRLSFNLSAEETALLELGFMPGRKGALAFRAAVTHWTEDHPWLGFGGGIYWHVVGTDRNADLGQFLSLVPHAAIRCPALANWNIEISGGPAFTLADYGDAEFSIGIVGSGGVSYRW